MDSSLRKFMCAVASSARTARGRRTVVTCAVMCPGQGAQKPGMGKDLFDSFAKARAVFQEVDDTLQSLVSKSMFFGTQAELARTELTQPALLAHSVAAFRIAQEECGLQLKPTTVVMGHSVGEFGALVASGSMSLSHAARLLQARGRAMQEAADREAKSAKQDQSAMCMKALLLGVPVHKDRAGTSPGLTAATRLRNMADTVAEACDNARKSTSLSVQMAALNSPQQLVLSGHTIAVDAAIALLKGEARYKEITSIKKVVPLPVSAPFHSTIMRPAASALEQLLYETVGPSGPFAVPIGQPTGVFVSNVHASPLSVSEVEREGTVSIRQALVQCVTSPVLWAQSVQAACDGVAGSSPVRLWVEVGCGTTLAGLIKQVVPAAAGSSRADADAHTVISVGTVEDIKALKEALQRLQLS